MKRLFAAALLLSSAAFAGTPGTIPPQAPKLLLMSANAAACQQMSMMGVPFAESCKPHILAIVFGLPVGSSVRFRVTFTTAAGPKLVTATVDTAANGTATYSLMTETDFSAPAVIATLLTESAPIAQFGRD